ncbi:hypothetical protein HPP92_023489 [Vanilla planifolia]|uniref:PIPK domain-containing protein n=1 Tax=Vanilla planifolia TaxID=51239 RepID=A0A835UE69_VANPL|nr:hypothetical protein HPP92_023489 [Vanilla planifolia]
MYFEGCPRRLGCTVILRGAILEELKKVKRVVSLAIFAAYHLLLQTSFLVDEGATLPKPTMNTKSSFLEKSQNIPSRCQFKETCSPKHFPRTGRFCVKGHDNSEREHTNLVLNAADDPTKRHDALEVFEEYFSTNDNQSILVSLSSTCIPKGAVCERSQLLRIKFYGRFDRPLGTYLLDELFDQTSRCRSCNEPAEVHSRCYTHQQGSLTITVRRLNSMKLPGEKDGKIWMWHRCLKCQPRDGIPPVTHRVVLSNAAWGLSFGKFLELSFSNHATANRLASCGHSLQKDCLRFYGWGSMVALFRYSPLDILSVYLPPLIIDFSGHKMQDWLRSEAISIMSSLNSLHLEVCNIIQKLELKIAKSISEPIKDIIHRHILQLKDVLKRESDDYSVLLKPAFAENNQLSEGYVDILELNRLKRSLLIDSILWDHRLCLVDSLSKSRSSTAKVHPQVPGESGPTQVLFESIFSDDELYNQLEESTVRSWTLSEDWSSKSPEEFDMQEVESNCSTEFSEVCVSSAGRSVVSGQCLGEHIKQVTVKHLKGGREMKMDLMVMENLFYERNVSRIYDLKGSSWARYNADTSGSNKVLLDLNLLETLRTRPIFLGSKAKRKLERAIWNDTSLLASIDVMDYSLLVGVDESKKELVIGIIDYMRQYTWDKHLETWVKASGILGGPKNASPTVISPLQYKKRFRKAMSKYFPTVPDQWSS